MTDVQTNKRLCYDNEGHETSHYLTMLSVLNWRSVFAMLLLDLSALLASTYATFSVSHCTHILILL